MKGFRAEIKLTAGRCPIGAGGTGGGTFEGSGPLLARGEGGGKVYQPSEGWRATRKKKD